MAMANDPWVDETLRKIELQKKINQLECESLEKEKVIARINNMDEMIYRHAKVLDLVFLPPTSIFGPCVADVLTDKIGHVIASFSWDTMNGKVYSGIHIQFPY